MDCPETLHAPLLTGVNKPWEVILPEGRKLTVRGPSLFEPFGDRLDFYYLASGIILVMHADMEGNERATLRIGPGCLFNESPALAGFDAPDSPFLCQTDCTVYGFSHALLHDPAFVAARPELIINLMNGLGVKLLMHHTSLSNFVGVSAVARVSRFLCALALRRHSLAFDPGMTQEDLATLLGMHRATLVRALHELRRQGALLRFTKRRVEIGDMEILKRLAGTQGRA
ncbi:MAG: Crp/Fnr family transcriptional regulator [Desulfovibrio sp.]|nr:Crp/Fnr family transcriptional regulator [Desulfovibrio sp.]